jgi:ketosteroid isomerase-like protein
VTLRRLALVLWLVLAVSGCAPVTLQEYQPKDREEALVVATLLKLPNGIKARSVDLILQPYADDVYIGGFQRYLGVAGRTAPQSIGKSDLRSVYSDVFDASKDVTMVVKNIRLTVSGDRAVAEAETELIFKKEAVLRGEARQDVFRNDVTWRLRRTPLGWRIVEEIWQ